ncbi:MAG: hypothetical protein OEV42_16125 [Deltaproteobacteria bacterium]|nr:hypothetical protein [Deltaproteobacteria bacterium]
MKKPVLKIVTHVIAVVIGISIGFFGDVLNMSGIFYESTNFKFPEQVIREVSSPDKKFTARILYDKDSNNYYLSIEGQKKSSFILTNELVPGAGYHDPLIRLSWTGPKIVEIIVDHDFGEGKLVYEFDVDDVQLRRKEH